MKYIIKNCPCYDNRIWQEPTCNINTADCKDIPDCLLKRIAEMCKDEECEFADEILKLLDIEECE